MVGGLVGLALSNSFASLSRLASRLASSLACSASSFFRSFSGSAMVYLEGARQLHRWEAMSWGPRFESGERCRQPHLLSIRNFRM